MTPRAGWPVVLVLLGALCAVAAALWAHAALDAFDARSMPLAMAGAPGVPRAAAFNALVFVVPGLCATVAAAGIWQAKTQWPPAARIGAVLAVLAGLAHAGQGVWPLQGDLMASAGVRLHAAVWMGWWLAAASAGLAVAAGLARSRPTTAVLSAVGAGLVAGAALNLVALPPGWANRASVAAWGAWMLLLAMQAGASRSDAAASQP